MELVFAMIRDMVIIGIIASFCDLLLPDSEVRRPVRLVFGLYFMALMLNPLVSFFSDTELAAIDFSSLGEQEVAAVESEYTASMVYREASVTLSEDIERQLNGLYSDADISVTIVMTESGFQSAEVAIHGDHIDDTVIAAEIKDLLVKEYGIPSEVVSFIF